MIALDPRGFFLAPDLDDNLSVQRASTYQGLPICDCCSDSKLLDSLSRQQQSPSTSKRTRMTNQDRMIYISTFYVAQESQCSIILTIQF